MQRGDHIGAQVYASIHGKTQVDLAMGEARPSPGVALTTGSLGLWMSAGKPVTAIAVAQLLDAGLVELDDPVAEYLPGFERHGKEGITLRHVLTHTGGFRAANVNYPTDPWKKTIEAVCDARLEPGWVPGERAGYHVHTGWYALGAVIEAASGEAFGSYLRRHIMEPLGMRDCWITMPREVYRQLGEKRTVMPDTSGDVATPAGFESEDWYAGVRPGGNAYGPANQLGRFYEMLLDLSPPTPGNPGSPGSGGGPGELDGVKILSPETAQLFTQRHRQGLMDRTFGHVMDWALGFMLPPEKKPRPGRESRLEKCSALRLRPARL